MKKIALFFVFLVIVSAIATAATVTQTTASVNKVLAPSTRMQTVIDAVSDISKVDLPAIIAEINRAGTSAVINLTYGTNTWYYMGATTNLSTNTIIYVNGVTITQ